MLEERLSKQRYLVGHQITEADWRLFTTLIRFDSVYYSHFKCNLRRVADYPNLWNYLRDLYQVPSVAETVSIEQIKRHYYGSQRQVNPTGIVPIGPQIDFPAPHDRARLKLKHFYHNSAGGRPLSTSEMRSRVARDVSAGNSLGAKKPWSMIS